MKLISIILPVYNARETVLSTLESVKSQTYKNYELIIINDGSTDDSGALIERFLSNNKDLNTKFIERENGGVSSARNRGIAESRGDYIAFIDSDDVWSPDKLKIQYDILEDDPATGLLGDNTICGSLFSSGYIVDISFRRLLFKCYFCTPGVIISRQVVDKVGVFNEEQNYSEDYEYWLRISKHFKCCLVNSSLVTIGGNKPTFGHSGLSANLKQMEKYELLNYRKLYRNKDINLFLYLIVISSSYLKYIRRRFIVFNRKYLNAFFSSNNISRFGRSAVRARQSDKLPD
ncbi:MAG: glycosyltransferase [Prevotellaceae bacterium]|jgi:glycosyltransferase involved in cell wall biosynthesis|nr:glycosyltransferase [Prevotellaceae bacterium]